uniref:Putative Fis-like DNA-binding protein n=1 Tax=Candidatus Kentrum sp. FM TaxID=2126340 RepID=A0A450VUX8_9GAMM|nr:MAG: Fis family transcriptional regulator, factor for inversion stimulation protein [Candidatus Kentron sp. FM]VFJ55335.1 MAG: Fis family transcriptional regulator, factor for inversion stimulation protein [Candidatus Kentron sp. FM]VFK08621.1 MAG: Fis family transcriptional regulator, factor for inversion stimulation protein [Candidatus Kentron sp. FM]
MAPDDMTQTQWQQEALNRYRKEPDNKQARPLRECVRDAIDAYFSNLDGHPTSGLYRMVLDEVEAPLLESVLRQTRGNHSRAAELLGINRATLRKKLRQHQLDYSAIKEE